MRSPNSYSHLTSEILGEKERKQLIRLPASAAEESTVESSESDRYIYIGPQRGVNDFQKHTHNDEPRQWRSLLENPTWVGATHKTAEKQAR